MPNARTGLPALLALACASAPPALPPGVSAEPRLGDSLALLLAKLPHAEQPGPSVELAELRVLDVASEPWTALEPSAARAAERVAVVAGRRCSQREGLRAQRTARASWFLLTADALVAFDHDGFTVGCATHPLFEPGAVDDVPVERMLSRYVSQRWPDDAIAPDEHLPRGLKLLARERPDDALAELQALDRRIEELERRERDPALGDEAERELWREEALRLGRQRARLERALRERQGHTGEVP